MQKTTEDTSHIVIIQKGRSYTNSKTPHRTYKKDILLRRAGKIPEMLATALRKAVSIAHGREPKRAPKQQR